MTVSDHRFPGPEAGGRVGSKKGPRKFWGCRNASGTNCVVVTQLLHLSKCIELRAKKDECHYASISMAFTKRKELDSGSSTEGCSTPGGEPLRHQQKQRASVADSRVCRCEAQKKMPVPCVSSRLSPSLHLWESQDRPGDASATTATTSQWLTTRKLPSFLTNAPFPAWVSEAGPHKPSGIGAEGT